MIKKYKDFLLLEKFNSRYFERNWDDLQGTTDAVNLGHIKSSMQLYRRDFSKKIKALSEYFEGYFTNIAQDETANPENDFNEMQSFINRTGFTLEIIKKLFDKKVCVLLDEYLPNFIAYHNLDEVNGYVDIYLYLLDQKLEISKDTGKDFNVELSGLSDLMTGKKDIDNPLYEWVIKYAYGYHKTPYGKLFLKQLGLTPESFVKKVFEKIHENCFESFIHDTNCINYNDINVILDEIREDGGLIKQDGDLFKIYLEAFWVIIKHFIKEKSGVFRDYESFKEYFIEWLKGVVKCEVEDNDMIVQFILKRENIISA